MQAEHRVRPRLHVVELAPQRRRRDPARRAPLGWGPHRARTACADVRGAASSFLKRINFLMTRSHQLSSGPPPEVLDEIELAWERAQAPLEGAYELHFEHDPALRRAWGELPDPGVCRRPHDGRLRDLRAARRARLRPVAGPVELARGRDRRRHDPSAGPGGLHPEVAEQSHSSLRQGFEAQHCVVDHLVSARMLAHRLGGEALNLVGHDANAHPVLACLALGRAGQGEARRPWPAALLGKLPVSLIVWASANVAGSW